MPERIEQETVMTTCYTSWKESTRHALQVSLNVCRDEKGGNSDNMESLGPFESAVRMSEKILD